jgi:tryptophan-rich sensory protein
MIKKFIILFQLFPDKFLCKLSFLVIPAIVFCVALLGAYFTGQGEINWYYTLKFPSWAPAGSFISAMWSIIYVATAVSILYVWNYGERNRFFFFLIFLFIINGFLNVLWSWLFFSKHLIGATVLETAALEISTITLIILVRRISTLASILLLPYALWVLFAQYLIYEIWKLNV